MLGLKTLQKRDLCPFFVEMEGKSDSGDCNWGGETVTRDSRILSIVQLFFFISIRP